MNESVLKQSPPLLSYFAPTGKEFIGLISIPHSGETIPPAYQSYLTTDEQALAKDVDTHVDRLIDIPALQDNGIGVLVAHIHRVFVDLNRSAAQSVFCWKKNTHNEICVLSDPAAETIAEIKTRYYHPYYEILRSLFSELKKSQKGTPSFIDLHSMPSRPTEYHFKQNPHQKVDRASFCVSDLKGRTCTPQFIQNFSQSLQNPRYSVAINDPYVGGHITEFAHQFSLNNIQIEINRSIYMNEISRELIPHLVDQLKPYLTDALIKGFQHFANQT